MADPLEEIIRRAIEEGKFADLAGKGKPLRMEENPHEDPEWRAAHHILKTAGFSLPWIETLGEINRAAQELRAGLDRAWQWRQASITSQDPRLVEAEWQRAQAAFRKQVVDLNKRIADYNLQAPSPRFQRPKLDADREIEQITRPTK